MVDPRNPYVFGITLDAQGVAKTKVIITNFSNGNILIKETNSNKQIVFDAANFEDGYTNGDVIGVENIGASIGGNTLTIDTIKGFQTVEIDAAAVASVNLSM